MEYRQLPHGSEQERLSVLGLGMGGIQKSSDAEIEQVIRTAIENGINFFDLCAGGRNVYQPFGKAIAGQREKVFFQLHFGAVYNENGEYGWSRDLSEIQPSTIRHDLSRRASDTMWVYKQGIASSVGNESRGQGTSVKNGPEPCNSGRLEPYVGREDAARLKLFLLPEGAE